MSAMRPPEDKAKAEEEKGSAKGKEEEKILGFGNS